MSSGVRTPARRLPPTRAAMPSAFTGSTPSGMHAPTHVTNGTSAQMASAAPVWAPYTVVSRMTSAR